MQRNNKPAGLPTEGSGLPILAKGSQQVASITVLMRLSVLRSCPGHSRVGGEAASAEIHTYTPAYASRTWALTMLQITLQLDDATHALAKQAAQRSLPPRCQTPQVNAFVLGLKHETV